MNWDGSENLAAASEGIFGMEDDDGQDSLVHRMQQGPAERVDQEDDNRLQ